MADDSNPILRFMKGERLWIAGPALAAAFALGFGLKTYLYQEHVALADRQRSEAETGLGKARDATKAANDQLSAQQSKAEQFASDNRSLNAQLASANKDIADLKAKLSQTAPQPPPSQPPKRVDKFAETVSYIDKNGLNFADALPILDGRYTIQGAAHSGRDDKGQFVEVCEVIIQDSDDPEKRSISQIKKGTRADISVGNRAIRILYRGASDRLGCTIDATILR